MYARILIAMVLGLLLGGIAVRTGHAQWIYDWVKPFGDIFIRLLKFIAVPLVLFSLIRGIGNLGDIRRLSRMGLKTIGIYLGTTVVAVVVGLTLVSIIQPGKVIGPDTALRLQQEYHTDASLRHDAAQSVQESAPLDFLTEIVPENLFFSLSDNSGMLQVIFIAILFGVAVVLCGKTKTAALMKVIENVDGVLIKIVDIVMLYAPFGVTALMATLMADSAGDASLLSALGLYALTVVLGLLTLIFGFYPLLIRLFTRIPLPHFFRTMSSVQLLAFSTSSSAATLPLNMEKVEQELKVPESITSFVLPVGMTINMDGTSCYQAVATLFIAQVMGVDLGWGEIATIIAATTVSSIGTPGIPGGSVVILLMVLSSVGIPPEGLALILGIDRPLDMLRTVVNVTGDATVASVIAGKKESV